MRVFAPVVVRGEEDKGVRLFEFRNTNDHIINPKIPLKTGLSETFSWFKENIDLYKERGIRNEVCFYKEYSSQKRY